MPFSGQFGLYDTEPSGTCRATLDTLGTRLAPHDPFELVEDVGMDLAALTRMQIRVVLTVFRAEMTRLERADPLKTSFDAGRLLRLRSIELLDTARARLNGEGLRYPELLGELNSARDEVSGEERAEVSAGSRGGRPE